MTKTTTKNRRAVGTLGVAAVIAVLAVSMIAMNFTSPVLADHEPAKAAKKAGMTMTNPDVAPTLKVTGDNLIPLVKSLGHFDIKSQDKGDWLVDSTIECATAIETTTKGKKNESKVTEGGFAGAKVWFTLDGQPISIKTGDRLDLIPDKEGFFAIPSEATWNLCEQVFEMDSNFNDLIISCEEAWATYGEVPDDPEDPDDIYSLLRAACPNSDEQFEIDNGLDLIPDDPFKLVFLCAIDPSGECAQSLTVFTKNAGTHPAMIMIHDVSAGTSHTVEAWVALDAGPSAGSSLEVTMEAGDNPDFGSAGVMIGKRIFVAEPVQMQTVTSEG